MGSREYSSSRRPGGEGNLKLPRVTLWDTELLFKAIGAIRFSAAKVAKVKARRHAGRRFAAVFMPLPKPVSLQHVVDLLPWNTGLRHHPGNQLLAQVLLIN